MNSTRALRFFAILVMLAWSATSRGSDNSLKISVGTGSDLSATEILDAVYSLSTTHSVEIVFQSSNGKSQSVTALSRNQISNMPCDWMVVSLKDGTYAMNEEALEVDQLRERVATYVESARLLDSMAFTLVDIDADASGIDLVKLFDELATAGLTQIFPTHRPERGEPQR